MKSKPFFPALLIITIFLTALLGACSFDYEQAELAGTLTEGIPNSIVREYTYVDIRPGQSSFKIFSSEARMYHEDHLTTLEDVFFQEIDENGEVVTEGDADSAYIDTETDNIEIRGSIHFVSTLHEMSVAAEYLYWNNQDRTLEGREDEEVVLEKSDGTIIQGKGFSVDSPRRIVDFRTDVEGIYVYSDENQE